jgi:hypothetical protein
MRSPKSMLLLPTKKITTIFLISCRTSEHEKIHEIVNGFIILGFLDALPAIS